MKTKAIVWTGLKIRILNNMFMFVYSHWKLAALENKLPTPTSVTRIYPGSYLNYSLPWVGAKLFSPTCCAMCLKAAS